VFANPTDIHYKSGFLFVVAEKMDDERLCHDCRHRQTCQQIYAKLGRDGVPSVLRKVLLGLLLPLVIFVVSVASISRLFSALELAVAAQAICSFVTAVAATICFVLVLRVLEKRAWPDT